MSQDHCNVTADGNKNSKQKQPAVKMLWPRKVLKSRLTSSEWQGQEEVSCVQAYVTTGKLFTGTNAVNIAAWSSWVLLLSYYRANTFLLCRLSKPKMNELRTTVPLIRTSHSNFYGAHLLI